MEWTIEAFYRNNAIHRPCINWDYDVSFVFTTEEYWDIFIKHVTTAIDLSVPQHKRIAKQLRNSKSYPRYLKNMLNRKALLWKKWRLSNLIQAEEANTNYNSKRSALSTYLRNKEMDIISIVKT